MFEQPKSESESEFKSNLTDRRGTFESDPKPIASELDLIRSAMILFAAESCCTIIRSINLIASTYRHDMRLSIMLTKSLKV